MRKDYIGTLEAIELGETVIFPVEARDYYSIHSAASRCKRDVYKRQLKYIEPLRRKQTATVETVLFKDWEKLPALLRELRTDDCPVSYTHLDVYKRQV